MEPIAADIAEGLLIGRPDLRDYPHEVAAWARAEARCLLIERHASKVGLLDEDGAPRGFATKLLMQFEREAARGRMALGLTPGSSATIARERAATAAIAVDIDAVLARGRAANARREAVGVLDGDPVTAALEQVRQVGREAMERAAAEQSAPATNDNESEPE